MVPKRMQSEWGKRQYDTMTIVLSKPTCPGELNLIGSG